ncbi:TIGR04283 family arsenosugar biosynthesis glycosyltransferase [Chitinophaga barathri]|uniref:Glycosyltransferase n=1 Tax=Chitinophaga barathri TaxID=1647451 RepID=A0A3N4MSD8_9BACT|nr:TIGR04283 family arsenosugar biosynthesis glycosyltransferase [Chitinophaga barathri]RPD43060.1 glycosyltransferase [Chitinophaga barathri]
MISIIIPTLNEADHIGNCIQRLVLGRLEIVEIIVVDASPTDHTRMIAESLGATVFAVPKVSRAFQMNFGARKASGNILYFVHADVLPPVTYAADIMQAVHEGFAAGRFRFRFASGKMMLKLNAWFTRFDRLWTSGGDETLFVKKDVFDRCNGYDEKYVIMEEYDLIKRIRISERFRIIPKDVVVSARKYDQNSWWKVQRANFTAFRLFSRGEDPSVIRQTYHSMIRHPKDSR